MENRDARCLGWLRAGIVAGVAFIFGSVAAAGFTPAHPVIGTLESKPARIGPTNDAGARGVVVGISWDRAEPAEGQFDATYFRAVKEEIAAFRAGAKLVVLDLGVQYPPGWIRRAPSSFFVNQYGHRFEAAAGSGDATVAG